MGGPLGRNLPLDEEIALRKWAVEQAAIALSGGGGKPNHLAYIAGDILLLIETGRKPSGPSGTALGQSHPDNENRHPE